VLVTLLSRSLRARRSRVLLALLAVTLGTGVATALGTLALQVGDDLARTLRAAGPNFVMRPEGASWRPDAAGGVDVARAGVALPESAVAALRSTFWRNNVLAAAPEMDVRLRVRGQELDATGTWFAHDLVTAAGPWHTGLAALHPRWTVAGAWPADTAASVVLGRALARTLGASVGDAVTLSTSDAHERAAAVHVAAIVDAGGLDDRRLWLPLALAQRLTGRDAELDRVALSALVKPEPTSRGARPPDPARDPQGYERYMCTAYPANVARDLSHAVPGCEVVQLTELVAGEAGVVWRLNLLMLLLALAAITASTLGLVSTTTAGVVERAREFGLMRALGATSTQLAVLLLTESLVVALAGGALGWVFGTATAAAIRGDAFAAPAAAQPLLLPAALLVAAAVAVAGTLAPMRMALRFDPIEALRG
jgi:putative ABC transport system permease protein